MGATNQHAPAQSTLSTKPKESGSPRPTCVGTRISRHTPLARAARSTRPTHPGGPRLPLATYTHLTRSFALKSRVFVATYSGTHPTEAFLVVECALCISPRRHPSIHVRHSTTSWSVRRWREARPFHTPMESTVNTLLRYFVADKLRSCHSTSSNGLLGVVTPVRATLSS